MNSEDVQRLGTIRAARAQGFLKGFGIHEYEDHARVLLDRRGRLPMVFSGRTLSRALQQAETWLIEQQAPSRVPALDECLHACPLSSACDECARLLELPDETEPPTAS